MLNGERRDVIEIVRETTDGHFHYDRSRDGSDGRVSVEAVNQGRAGVMGSRRRGVIRIIRPGRNWKHTQDHEIVSALRDPSLWGSRYSPPLATIQPTSDPKNQQSNSHLPITDPSQGRPDLRCKTESELLAT